LGLSIIGSDNYWVCEPSGWSPIGFIAWAPLEAVWLVMQRLLQASCLL
jgi:hypothetical protein